MSLIANCDFDHGAVRHEAALKSRADIVVFMTQDAMPADEDSIARLVAPIVNGKAEISYCRQVARADADIIERFTREFNYPPKSRIKTKADLPSLGIKTFFCTDVCAAYKKSAYEELGGFERPVILNEDSILAARAILAGCRVSYSADAGVIHSHNYSGIKQFHRNFDIGVSHAMYPDIFGAYPSEKEGIRLVRETCRHVLGQKRPHLIFKVIWLSGWKYLGYLLGKRYKCLSDRAIRKYTMNPGFWDKYSDWRSYV